MKILFVCLANTCRSPMAEAVMRHLLAKEPALGWTVDSAAIADWNVGGLPNARSLEVLRGNGLKSRHISRQIRREDFYEFDFILGMDESNLYDLRKLAPQDCRARIELLGKYRMEEADRIIVDPYFEKGIRGFKRCYNQIVVCCRNFIEQNRTACSGQDDSNYFGVLCPD
ncbi:low molecular weight protein-tyrosine-phosphatase [Culex quinquefasciatus]|uniref:Low molecular weight phosphotyrosine protein phosphatase n=1 Tax=Culex quinquefasciatus TaxID=7176 RepID=B0W219_CULQU|nr:low molecular weight protein-tyrosine-phosphatase [Culex quinquefasciatus]|eukprot:XP_001842753.1 low molecular weight protein-tyrosine-phosphatase [Culex quinquefasciatus]